MNFARPYISQYDLYLYKTHLNIFHANDGNDEDDFKCAKCGKTYSSQRSLNAHMASHGRESDATPVGRESSRSKWQSYRTKDVTGSEEQERVYNVKLPDFINSRVARAEQEALKENEESKYGDISSILSEKKADRNNNYMAKGETGNKIT